MTPAVHVGPGPSAEIRRAVERGGARVTDDPAEARAIVWLGMDPAALGARLTSNVEWVHLRQAGVDRWITAGLIDGRRVWTSSAGVFGAVVGERALALLLAGVHRLGEHAGARRWSPVPAPVLHGRTVAVLGTGSIGQAVARLATGFGARAVGISRRGRPVAPFAEVRPATAWPDACTGADHLVVAAPLTAATAGMVGRAALAGLAPGAVLVNVGRGPVVDTDAVVESLAVGHLGGVGLDVTEPEPLPDGHPLWDDPRVIVTSHTANPGAEHRRLLTARVEANVARWRAGRTLLGRVDATHGY